MHFSWARKRTIANAAELVENVRLRGGSIVQYQHIESVLIAWEKSAHFEWVGPGESRRMAGLKHAVRCGLLGWWSLGGLVGTPVAIAANLTGGVDVTEAFVEPDGVIVKPGVMQAEQTRQGRITKIIGWLAFVVVIGGTIALALLDDRPRRR